MHTTSSTTPLVTVVQPKQDTHSAPASALSGSRQHQHRLSQFEETNECVEKYKQHFSFLRDAKFLRDLENDSVDSDLIEEELNALQQGPIRTRDKVVKFLQSNPVQIILCVVVLLDAGVVIAQILLDLNSVKERLQKKTEDLDRLVNYIKIAHPDRLLGYDSHDIDEILRLLRQSSDLNNSSSFLHPIPPAPPDSNSNSNNFHGDSTIGEHFEGHDIGHGTGSNVHHASYDAGHPRQHNDLHEVAHALHFASIAMLGLLVVEDLIKIIAMGKNFFKHKIEIFDAIIIGASFTIDLVFLGGVSGEEGQKAAAVLVVLLLWRIARVVDGIVITVKQRQEFRIRLQKRARRAAEKKLEMFEEERHTRTKQIEALKDLCNKAGINEADIAACTPKHHGQLSATLGALSSVARLSVSMTMLMSSGAVTGRHHSSSSGRSPDLGCANYLLLDEKLARIESLSNVYKGKFRGIGNGSGASCGSDRCGSAAGSITCGAGAKRKAFGSKAMERRRARGGRRGASEVTPEESTTSSCSSLTQFSVTVCTAGPAGEDAYRMCPSPGIESSRPLSYHPSGTSVMDPSGGFPVECNKRIIPGLSPSHSPVNSSGVSIIIDRGSDWEMENSPTEKTQSAYVLPDVKTTDVAKEAENPVSASTSVGTITYTTAPQSASKTAPTTSTFSATSSAVTEPSTTGGNNSSNVSLATSGAVDEAASGFSVSVAGLADAKQNKKVSDTAMADISIQLPNDERDISNTAICNERVDNNTQQNEINTPNQAVENHQPENNKKKISKKSDSCANSCNSTNVKRLKDDDNDDDDDESTSCINKLSDCRDSNSKMFLLGDMI